MAQLLSLSATHYSQLLVPLALEDMGSHTSGQQLHGWTKDVERVKDMLHTKLTGLVHDAQYVSKQVEHYEMEEDKDRPGRLIFRCSTVNYGSSMLMFASILLMRFIEI
ncbi:uncharacterized protein LOC126295386 [Schistocerca gregaria]|uniref:uncharacterized protein LOC126295386 n=1 Tax=Schistocerca gregaria TaxID=7010 RepID=UPI00211E5AE4|nr:uncharacterized protein LOC126295386 [Schistocerca gregaria]